MDLRLIEMFQAVIEHGSVTEAARALRITQPAVSGAIARLEKEVGFALFRRQGRHVLPTAEALLFSNEATRAMAAFRQLTDAASGISAAQLGTLTIASNPSPGINWLPRIVAAFRRDRPQVTVRMLTRSSQEVRDLLSARAYDIGIAEPPFDRTDVLIRRYRVPLVCALPEGHPLAARDHVTPQLLDGENFVTTTQGRPMHIAIEQAFECCDALFRPVIACEFMTIALNLVAQGAGVCVADPISAAAMVGRGIAVRPFVPAINYEVALLRPARGELTRLASEFAAAFDDHLKPFLAP